MKNERSQFTGNWMSLIQLLNIYLIRSKLCIHLHLEPFNHNIQAVDGSCKQNNHINNMFP